jgi:predicted 3-demethylubiquinone-9 3-methyltransferase (glyoxalase superfamily)
MTIAFNLNGQQFVALNGGPQFKFTPAISFVVTCDTQQEIDDYWEKLCAGGEAQQCGWLQDKFGLSWQIIPTGLGDLLKDPRSMQAMLGMKKLDIDALKRAAMAR